MVTKEIPLAIVFHSLCSIVYLSPLKKYVYSLGSHQIAVSIL